MIMNMMKMVAKVLKMKGQKKPSTRPEMKVVKTRHEPKPPRNLKHPIHDPRWLMMSVPFL